MMTLPHPSELHALHLNGGGKLTWEQIGAIYGRKGQAIRSKVRRWLAHQDRDSLRVVPIVPAWEPLEEPLRIEDLDDTEAWNAARARLLREKEYITVMHMCDVHSPYEHEGAMECFYTLAGVVQPDVIVRGSDEDDNPSISMWALEGQEEVTLDDFLETQRSHRARNTKRLKRAAPKAIQINIDGNHDHPRFKKWMLKYARAAKNTLTREYIQNIRCDGDVLFIGFKRSIRIGSLVVMHGFKYGDNAARQTLLLRSNAVNIIAGHSHKPQMYSTVGDKPVTCAISGCLCKNPHYGEKDEDEFSTWQRGTVVATLHVPSQTVAIEEVRFNPTDDGMWFRYGGRIYTWKPSTLALAA